MRALPLALLIVLLTVMTAAIIGDGVVVFGRESYWAHHGVFLLIFLTFFPRLTLLFSSLPFGGLWWWLGFFFLPRYLVAMLATISYGLVNPFLVTCAWVVALAGESTEKYVVKRRVIYYPSNRGRSKKWRDEAIDVDARDID
jgi:hypothetical protein